MTFERAESIAARLPRPSQNGQGWIACCPAHDDTNPSLSITEHEGKVLFKCFAGCSQEAVIAALKSQGLWPPPSAERPRKTTYHLSLTPTAARPFMSTGRTHLDGHKKILQQLPDGQWKAYPAPRPLFNLPLIDNNPQQPVLVVEGEKTVLAAAALFPVDWVVTTSAGGSNAAKQSDWRVLKGRDILIWPDNDPPGHTYAKEVERLCEDAGARRVVIFPYPDDGRFPDGWDLADPFPEDFRIPDPRELLDTTPRPQTSRGFTFTPWSEASEEPEEQVSWVVDDMLPVGGLSMMAAKPKVGKSTAARCLAAAVAQGKPWLGKAVEQGPVAYVALEEKRSEVLRHFRQMGLPKSAPLHIHTEQAPEQALTRLREYIEDSKPVLVIVDPLFLFVRFKDGNDYAESMNQLDPVRALARDTGCHILVTHHSKKSGGAGGDEVLGSTGLFGAVDCLLSMKRSEHYRSCSSIQRYGTDLEEVVLKLDAETGWVDIAGAKADVDTQAKGEEVFAFLEEQEEPVMEKDIRKGVGGNTRLIPAALRALVEKGEIERTGEGKKNKPYRYNSRFLVSSIYKKRENEKNHNSQPISDQVAGLTGTARDEATK